MGEIATATSNPQGRLRAALQKNSERFASLLPDSGLTPERFTEIAVRALAGNDKLQKAASSNTGMSSLLSAIGDAAKWGLQPGVTCHLVPFGNAVQLILGYKGAIALAMRSDSVQSVQAFIVYEGERFEHHRTQDGEHFLHVPEYDDDKRGKMIAAYAEIRLKNGSVLRHAMTAGEIAKRKAVSKSAKYGGPWSDWPDEMAKKTAILGGLKYVELSAEDRRIVEAIQSNESDLGSIDARIAKKPSVASLLINEEPPTLEAEQPTIEARGQSILETRDNPTLETQPHTPEVNGDELARAKGDLTTIAGRIKTKKERDAAIAFLGRIDENEVIAIAGFCRDAPSPEAAVERLITEMGNDQAA